MYSNQISICYGSDTWGAVRKALAVALTTPGTDLTSEERLDVTAVQDEMDRIEKEWEKTAAEYKNCRNNGIAPPGTPVELM